MSEDTFYFGFLISNQELHLQWIANVVRNGNAAQALTKVAKQPEDPTSGKRKDNSRNQNLLKDAKDMRKTKRNSTKTPKRPQLVHVKKSA